MLRRVGHHAHRTAKADQFCGAAFQRGFHRRSRPETAGHHQRDRDRILHRLGEIDEIGFAGPGRRRDILLLFLLNSVGTHQRRLFVGATGYFDQIDAGRFQPADHLQTILEVEPAFLEIGAVEICAPVKPAS